MKTKVTHVYMIECTYDGNRWPVFGMEDTVSTNLKVLRLRLTELRRESLDPKEKLSIAKYVRQK